MDTAINLAVILVYTLLGALGLLLYFMPVVVARQRNCKARDGIAIVNLFLGWTFIGWVVALAWAASGEQTTSPLAVAR